MLSEVIPKLILQRNGSYVKAHCLFSHANCGGQRSALNGQIYALTSMKYCKAFGSADNNKAILPLPPSALFFMIIYAVFLGEPSTIPFWNKLGFCPDQRDPTPSNNFKDYFAF